MIPMKREAQKKLLKTIAEVSDDLIKDKICWYGKEAVETAIMNALSDRLWMDLGYLKPDIEARLPKPTRPGEGK